MTPVVRATFAYVLQTCRGGPVVDLLTSRRAAEPRTGDEAPGPAVISVSPDPAGGTSLCARPASLPLASGSAGAVMLGDELWLDAEPHAVIEEAKRVLGPGGFLAVLVHAPRRAGRGDTASDEATWWAPTPDDAGSLLRRHLPYVSILELVPTAGCSLWSPRGEARDEHVLSVESPRAPDQAATHLLFIATRRPRKLAEGSPHRALGSALLDDARRDLADALADAAASRAAAAAQALRADELEVDRHRLSASLALERRRASDAIARAASLEERVRELEASLRAERERAAATATDLARTAPLLAREAGRATRAEAEQRRLEAAVAREQDRREAAEDARRCAEEALAAARAAAEDSTRRAEQLEQELRRETSKRHEAELARVDLAESLARARSEADRAAAALNEALRRADDLAEEIAALEIEKAR